MQSTISRLSDQIRLLLDVTEELSCAGGTPDDPAILRLVHHLQGARQNLHMARRAADRANRNVDRRDKASHKVTR